MTTQLFLASTGFGLATVVAALADGAFPDADRRVLVLSNNAPVPETAYGAADVAGSAPLLDAFDEVVDYNAVVAPQHPSAWQPAEIDLPIWERSLRALWGLEGDVHLIVERIEVAPARTLSRTFADAAIDVYADGLRSYGPTRHALPVQVSVRLRQLLYLDLVPGVTPLLLRENAVEPVRVTTESFRKVVAAVRAAADPAELAMGGGRTAVLIGQYLADLQLLTVEEERRLYRQMVEQAAAAGYTELVFKAHPGAPAGLTGPLRVRAAELGVRLQVRETPELVETWYAAGAVDLVVGCFSTALATAGLYGVPAARVGTELLLQRLDPYENGNRIPLTVVAATIPPLPTQETADPPPVPVDQLVTTVGYLMQPGRNADLRDSAAALLRQRAAELRPYLRRSRLTELDLPGAQPPGISLTGRLGPAGPLVKRILGPRLSRRLGDLVRRILRRHS